MRNTCRLISYAVTALGTVEVLPFGCREHFMPEMRMRHSVELSVDVVGCPAPRASCRCCPADESSQSSSRRSYAATRPNKRGDFCDAALMPSSVRHSVRMMELSIVRPPRNL